MSSRSHRATYSGSSSTSPYTRRLHYPPRADSPPASAYFSPFVGDGNDSMEMQPTPGAQAHFAYSTTLRRHSIGNYTFCGNRTGSFSIWNRFLRMVGVEKDDAHLEALGYIPPSKVEQTPSAKYSTYDADDVVSNFRSSTTHGLTAAIIPSLRQVHGYNEFSVSKPEPLLLKFAKTFYESPLILLLCGSAVVSAIMGNVDDAVSITIAITIVLTVGFVQERRSEKSLEALNKLVPHHCHIIRDGEQTHLLANEVVPGDLVTFTTGDRIPADVRLLAAVDLEIDESSLTGETTTRRKGVAPCASDAEMAERTCIAYMGTLVRNGRGSGIVIATGSQTEFGVIFSMMQEVEERRTPLQRSMDELAKNLSIISFGIIGIICLIGVFQRRPWLDMFTIGVSLAVAAIPEGLPIVTTVTLALGVLRMAKRKAIVKKLHSVEALGSVSVICSDKTGTLTRNEQTVTELYTVDEHVRIDPAAPAPPARVSAALRKTLEVGALCNNASAGRNEDGVHVGQATDVALLNALSTFGFPDPRQTFTRVFERPFSSELKSMAVSGTHATATFSNLGTSQLNGTGREMYYIKGSIDALLPRCKFYHVSEDSTPALDGNMRSVIAGKAQAAATRGLRVLAMAYGYGSVESTGPVSSAPSRTSSPVSGSSSGHADKEKIHLVFAGFVGMFDPPRKGVSDAVSLLQSGGVQVVMITGDAEETALSIARALGLRSATNPNSCLTGAALDRMSAAQLRERVGNVSVFARTSPKHKMAIVEAFQARGAVVAMTGDGVNDAPALKMADIGVSMGKSGTDVAKEAADVILVDDNFSTILPAVEEGKSIFHNIQNFLSFQLSTAAAALTLITLSTMFGLSNPLNAMQILFINILMDGPPSQSLGVDPVDRDVMRKPPRKKDEPIINRRIRWRVIFSASIIVIGTLFVFYFALSDDHNMSRRDQTMTFSSFVFLDLVSAIQNRGLGCGLTQNRMLLITVAISFLSQLGLVYVPFMQKIFQTEALPLDDLLFLFALSASSFALHEGRRRYERMLNQSETYATAMEELA
ncbi:calcium-transporting ATPase [Multifurca ochricompacta]|uniref:Calcium-transporting ATPase 1 n=1 Tax=Multifurca ochricompacta TaxID=376703 RepID=A0AAD4QN17_9AGAM|nr:calcium-transporting ATPase [Multifurca ochricompacta]